MFLNAISNHPFRNLGLRSTMIRQLQTFFSDDYLKANRNIKLADIVHQRTEITTNHLTPEIKLHLFAPDALKQKSNFVGKDIEDIFWAFYWPGGQALSRYILDNEKSVQNLNLVDIGCGCGATSIASMISNARKVIANDNDPIACTAAALNAKLNNVQLEILQGDILGKTNVPWDCILIGDMFYEEDQAVLMLDWLKHLHKLGKKILIGDPGRLSFEKRSIRKDLRLLAEYQLPAHTTEENRGFAHGYVWTFY